MTDHEMKTKYPAYWNAVEQAVLNDMDVMDYGVKEEAKKTIAHNAAFNATYELNRYLEKAEKADKLINLLRESQSA